MFPPLISRVLSHRRAVAGVAIVILVGIAIVLLFPRPSDIYHELLKLRQQQTLGVYIMLSSLFLIACLTSVLPASILGILCGMLLGAAQGSALAVASTMASAILAFVFSRYFFRPISRKMIARLINLESLESRLARHGWRYALLLRLAPLAPFSITSYALGLTPISLRGYVLTTLGSMPFLVVCVYLGSIGGVVLDSAGNVDGDVLRRLVLMFSIATILGALAVYALPKFVRRLLARERDSLAP